MRNSGDIRLNSYSLKNISHYQPTIQKRTGQKHVPAKEALAKAEKFVSFHPDFWKIQISGILNRQGNTIGYELRPLDYPTVFGYADVIRTYYKITGDKVVVYVKPNFRQHAPGIPFERGRSFGPR